MNSQAVPMHLQHLHAARRDASYGPRGKTRSELNVIQFLVQYESLELSNRQFHIRTMHAVNGATTWPAGQTGNDPSALPLRRHAMHRSQTAFAPYLLTKHCGMLFRGAAHVNQWHAFPCKLKLLEAQIQATLYPVIKSLCLVALFSTKYLAIFVKHTSEADVKIANHTARGTERFA